MFQFGDIITEENYVDAANWCNMHSESGLTIMEVNGQNLISYGEEPTLEEMALMKRRERDYYLSQTDKYLMSDFPITDEKREKYKEYRKYLRDLPASDLFPNIDVLTFDQWNA